MQAATSVVSTSTMQYQLSTFKDFMEERVIVKLETFLLIILSSYSILELSTIIPSNRILHKTTICFNFNPIMLVPLSLNFTKLPNKIKILQLTRLQGHHSSEVPASHPMD